MRRTQGNGNSVLFTRVYRALTLFLCIFSIYCGDAYAQTGRVGAFSLPDSPWDVQWQRFKQTVDKSGLNLDYYIRGELGSEEAMLTALKRNRLQVAGISLQGITSVAPELTVAMSPFLFSTAAEVDFVYDRYLLGLVNETLASQDLILLRWLESGWFSIASQEEIRLPSDLKGQRIGGSPNIATQEFLLALGADAIPIASIDLMQALDTGLIDGAIKPTALIYSNLRSQVQFVSLLRVAYDTGGLLANRSWFDGLDSSYQTALKEGHGPPASVREEVRDMVERQIADMREHGPGLIDLDEAERKEWEKSSQAVYRRIIERSGARGQTVYDAIRTGKECFKFESASAGNKYALVERTNLRLKTEICGDAN